MGIVHQVWAAGLFEGEHTVAFYSNFTLRVMRLEEAEEWPWQQLQARRGGRISLRRPINQQPHNEWILNARQAARFLADIRPFVSGEHARRRIDDLALRFQKQNVGGKDGHADQDRAQ